LSRRRGGFAQLDLRPTKLRGITVPVLWTLVVSVVEPFVRSLPSGWRSPVEWRSATIWRPRVVGVKAVDRRYSIRP
jgi:hypothetical protein